MAAIAVGFLAFIVWLAVAGRSFWHTATLQVNGSKYTLAVADDDAERAKGLSGRSHLATNEGMLFVYDQPGKHCFWMKDTRFPLDILWLDGAKKVVHIERGVLPDTYPKQFCPPASAQFVIELPPGHAAKRGINVHDRLTF